MLQALTILLAFLGKTSRFIDKTKLTKLFHKVFDCGITHSFGGQHSANLRQEFLKPTG